ncbi:unnamed protein product [Phytomonas sp. EM1]|nr:unnamed protein product [Phytomonas sp. EM1]|eukprot:CCW61641.1 unnamed protein product [Phytomonas sp. isolate EM1]
MYHDSQFYDIVSDQVVSGATILKETLSSLNIPFNMMDIFTLTWFKRNWKFLLYFMLLRKLYKMIAFRKIWKRLSIRSAIRSNPQEVDAGDSLLLKDGTDAPKNTPMNSEKTSIFRCMERQQPSTNQVIMADGMILVNRNDRYLEVYERRKVSKVDNIDEQVEALLQQFLPGNQKKP